jgi:hypothetical protein
MFCITNVSSCRRKENDPRMLLTVMSNVKLKTEIKIQQYYIHAYLISNNQPAKYIVKTIALQLRRGPVY